MKTHHRLLRDCYATLAVFVFALFASGCGGGGSGGGNPAATSDTTAATVDFSTMASNVKAALLKVQGRNLNSRDHTPWTINSALFALGKNLDISVIESGKTLKAAEYLCTEARYANQRIYRTLNGFPALPTRDISYGMTESFKIQDHVDQFLSVLGEVGIPATQQIIGDDGTTYTVADLERASEKGFRPSQELGWSLISLAVYNGLDKPFTNDQGQTYTISDILTLAIQRDTSMEARWGAHHLYAMAYLLQMRMNAGGTFDAPWVNSRSYLDRHVRLGRQYQQADGAFSGNMFSGSSYPATPDDLLETTGHMMLWLNVALNPDQLREDWIVRAVNRLAVEIINKDFAMFGESGIYMSAHALRQYSTILNLP